jgi:hypothetical protein
MHGGKNKVFGGGGDNGDDHDNMLACVRMTVNGGLDCRLDLLTTLTCGFVITLNNYSAIVNSHSLQITTAYAKSFQSAVTSPVVPW